MNDKKTQASEQGEQTLDVGISHINFKAPARSIHDVLNEIAPQGERLGMEAIEGKPITIHSVREFAGQYGPAAYVIFTDEHGELFNTVIGQKILLPKLLAVRNHLPVTATIIRREGGQFGEYYDFE